ncbi:MAG TPA: PEGA domain-containing protein [Polyangiales bacterium]|nr:PEGA domain-containing protein [Polyangiales bacterium]
MKQPIPFGKYFLLERINVGGMAEVFKAKATGVEGFERLVAVKRILPSIAEDEEFITMFVDEAKIAVQLTHANIAQIFDLGRVEGSFFIALEYVHGKDLRAIFNRTRQRGELLPIPLSCYAIMKLCEGLDYAHNKRDSSNELLNLVHRDVSPQNILVSYEGEVKIIDFGIAKAAGKAGRTQAGILKGKFGYMSPEQVLGLDIDRRSDVFGVGICLYELLTGERLFVAESDFATLEKVRAVDVMPPSTYNRRIPEELEQIVMRALARDRDQRYQTAIQLHDELQSFMHTSGNMFSRKDLSGYMHRVFAEEIDKESARDQEYAQLGTPNFVAESSGLEVFDEIDPVSTVSALHAQPFFPGSGQAAPKAEQMTFSSVEASSRPRTLPPTDPGSRLPSNLDGEPGSWPVLHPAPDGSSRPVLNPLTPAVEQSSRPVSSRPRKATLLGIPQVAVRPNNKAAPAVPRLVPRLQSVPPTAAERAAAAAPGLNAQLQPAAALPSSPSNPPLAPPQSSPQLTPPPDPHAPDAHGMEWDDEELSTQIYDKPDADSLAFVFGAKVSSPESMPSAPPAALIAPAFEQQVAQARPDMLPMRTQPALPAPAPLLQAEVPPWERKAKPSPMLVAVLVVIGIIACIVSGLVLFGKPEPGNVQFATVPTKVTVTVDGQPIASTTSPFVLAQLTPAQPHTIEVSQQNYRPWTNKVELEPGQTLQLPTVTLERIETGFAVDSEPPGASVVVDGKKLGETPARLIDLAPGEHQLRLEREGHAPWESVLHVSVGTVLPLQTVSLQVLPAAPPPTRGRAAATSGTLSASDASTRPRTRTSSADADPTTPAPEHATAAPRAPEPDEAVDDEGEPPPASRSDEPAGTDEGGPGTLRVNSRPWSQVFVDGKLIGVTPQRAISLPPGSHTLLLVNDEFSIRKTVQVEIKSGQITTQVLNLAPE